MNLMLLPLFGALVIGIVGFGLMFTGAVLGRIFGLTICRLFLVPGGIPWLRR
jgi:hypothetical protein